LRLRSADGVICGRDYSRDSRNSTVQINTLPGNPEGVRASSEPPDDDRQDDEPEPEDGGNGDPDALPENVPDDWLDPKPFDPAGR